MKEAVVSATNLMMFVTFLACFLLRDRVHERQKKDYTAFTFIGIIVTIMGFTYHFLRSQGRTVAETQLLWDWILYITVVMSFFYTSVAVRIFSTSERVLKNWKTFCKIKGVCFITIQYNVAFIRPYFPKTEILIFVISSLLPVVYVFFGFLYYIKRKDARWVGLGALFYILTVLNRILSPNSGDFNEVINGNSLMHLGIVIFVYSVYQKIKRI